MAFDATKMNRVNVGVNNLFIYINTDAIATVAAADYFLDFYSQLREGDVIIAIDTNVNTIDMLMVSASSSSTVTTVNGT